MRLTTDRFAISYSSSLLALRTTKSRGIFSVPSATATTQTLNGETYSRGDRSTRHLFWCIYEARECVAWALKSTDNLFNPNKCSNGDAKIGCGLFLSPAIHTFSGESVNVEKRTITDYWTAPNGVQGVSSGSAQCIDRI